jgi:hypothetical protein
MDDHIQRLYDRITELNGKLLLIRGLYPSDPTFAQDVHDIIDYGHVIYHDRAVWGTQKEMWCGETDGHYTEDESKVTCRMCIAARQRARDGFPGALWRAWTK